MISYGHVWVERGHTVEGLYTEQTGHRVLPTMLSTLSVRVIFEDEILLKGCGSLEASEE
jgi:hypothetical protein